MNGTLANKKLLAVARALTRTRPRALRTRPRALRTRPRALGGTRALTRTAPRALAIVLMLTWATGSAALGSTGGASAPGSAPGSSPAKSAHTKAKARRRAEIATWFGPGFYGQKTACGQTMTPVIVGVASRTLPCGTLVLVNYNGHRLTVPVIDRGPYANNGAVWDLTWGAASALTITETVRIKTKIVGRAANTPLLGVPAPAPLPAGAAASGGTAAS